MKLKLENSENVFVSELEKLSKNDLSKLVEGQKVTQKDLQD